MAKKYHKQLDLDFLQGEFAKRIHKHLQQIPNKNR